MCLQVFNCPFCRKSFRKRFNFTFHLRAVHNMGNKRVVCPTCGKDNFRNPETFRTHRKKCLEILTATGSVTSQEVEAAERERRRMKKRADRDASSTGDDKQSKTELESDDRNTETKHNVKIEFRRK